MSINFLLSLLNFYYCEIKVHKIALKLFKFFKKFCLNLRSIKTSIIFIFSYTIKNAQDWEAGEYKCVATVHGFPPKNLTHQLHLKGITTSFKKIVFRKRKNFTKSLRRLIKIYFLSIICF